MDGQPWRRPAAVPPGEGCGISACIFDAADATLRTIAAVLRRTGKTYELFHIAQLILGSPERFAIVLRRDAPSPFFSTIFDDLPFLNRDAAIGHLLQRHLGKIAAVEIVECQPPRGNFSLVARCPVTQELIAAPNHHSYKDLLRAHHMEHCSSMSFDRFCEKLEFSKNPEDIAAWTEQMGKKKVYRPLAEDGTVDSGQDAVLDSLVQLREFVEKNGRRFLRESAELRLDGSQLDAIVDDTIRRHITYRWEQQRRFPLETANCLWQRCRHHHLHCYRRGKRGISYVSSVARKFCSADSVFTPELAQVLAAIDAQPFMTALDLAVRLGGEEETVARSLDWLVREGYVAEGEDGKLFVHPQKQDVDKKNCPKNSSTTESCEQTFDQATDGEDCRGPSKEDCSHPSADGSFAGGPAEDAENFSDGCEEDGAAIGHDLADDSPCNP
jgi:hypothetical protein